MAGSDNPRADTARFTTTHWSLVLEAGKSGSPGAAAALESICRAYWQPLYAFLRRGGHFPEDARDLTQGFFEYLLGRNWLAAADRERGRFRTFLLTSLKHFLSHEHERATASKRGGGQPLLSLDQWESEEREELQPVDLRTPDMVFDGRWARLQVENALNHLRDDYAGAGRGALFDLLKDYVWGEKNTLNLSEIAAQLDLTEEAVKKAVQRLRQRFRDTLRAEVARTVGTPDQIEEELRYLRAALGSGS